MNTYYLILLLAAGLFGYLTDAESKCLTNNGTYVIDGESFSPAERDDCTTCLCKNGKAVKCSTMVCDVPECKYYIELEGCCQYQCDGTEAFEEENSSDVPTESNFE